MQLMTLECCFGLLVLQVTIASQRRYVGYWSKVLTFPNGTQAGENPDVHLPTPKARELRRIRLYDTVNIDTVQFVIHELKEVPVQKSQ